MSFPFTKPAISLPAQGQAPSMAPRLLPAQNHVHIRRENTRIEGSFLIDVSLPGGYGKNLSLQCRNSNIEANVWVKGEAKRCELEAVNENSIVQLCVCEREDSVPLNILAKTKNSNVTCLIPADFVGSLSVANQNGNIEIFHSLRQRLRIIDDNGRHRRYWVGEGYNEEEAQDWMGDACHVETQNGNVYVGFYEGRWGNGQQASEEGCSWCNVLCA